MWRIKEPWHHAGGFVANNKKNKKNKSHKTLEVMLFILYCMHFNVHAFCVEQSSSSSHWASHVDTVNVMKHVTKQGNMNCTGLKCTYTWQTEWKGHFSLLHYSQCCAWSMKGESVSVNCIWCLFLLYCNAIKGEEHFQPLFPGTLKHSRLVKGKMERRSMWSAGPAQSSQHWDTQSRRLNRV